MCMYIHIYIHTYIYTYIHTHTHVHTHTHTYIYIHHSTLIKKEILPFTTTQMDLDGIMLSKENQMEKD